MSQIHSIVDYFGCQKTNSCGYCKTTKGHSDHGMWLHYLAPSEYQNLIDRGWRRSGCYGYKPILSEACCPMYTIRCAACQIKLSKSQKKLIKRFNRFIVSGERRKWHCKDTQVTSTPNDSYETRPPEVINRISKQMAPENEQSLPASMITESIEPSVSVPEHHNVSTGHLPLPNKQGKKKTIRFEKAKKRIMGKGKTEQEALELLRSKKKIPQEKTLEQLLYESNKPNAVNKLEIKLVQSSPPNEKFEKTFDLEYKVYSKYQVIIHKDEPDHCTSQQFRRFLVKSPLEPQAVGIENAPVSNFGSYHQQYWLNDKLIAVAVIDILPRCISSVYFFYDPDYSDLVLGTYGALRELELVRYLQKYIPSLKFYYMGFYIHTCPKMRYKARITPSYLLCPEVYSWHPITECVEKLDEYGYSRLNSDPCAKDENATMSLDNILILYRDKIIRYSDFIRKGGVINENEIKEYMRAVGKQCAGSMILYRR